MLLITWSIATYERELLINNTSQLIRFQHCNCIRDITLKFVRRAVVFIFLLENWKYNINIVNKQRRIVFSQECIWVPCVRMQWRCYYHPRHFCIILSSLQKHSYCYDLLMGFQYLVLECIKLFSIFFFLFYYDYILKHKFLFN